MFSTIVNESVPKIFLDYTEIKNSPDKLFFIFFRVSTNINGSVGHKYSKL